MGIEIYPPHINASNQDYTAENGGIRVGLSAINGLGPKLCKHILGKRGDRPFSSIRQFCRRVTLPREIILRLSLAGAFLGVPLNERRQAYG